MKLSGLFLLACLIGGVLGEANVYLPHDLVLSWDLSNEKEAIFTLIVPDSEKAEFKWAGIGFKDPKYGDSMRKGDIVVIHFCSETLEDRWAEENGLPAIDEDLGGTDDIDNEDYSNETGYFEYVWRRDYVTGDVGLDNDLVEDTEYMVIWALGFYEDDGVTLKRHKINNRGSQLITFSRDCPDGDCAVQEEETSFLALNH